MFFFLNPRFLVRLVRRALNRTVVFRWVELVLSWRKQPEGNFEMEMELEMEEQREQEQVKLKTCVSLLSFSFHLTGLQN